MFYSVQRINLTRILKGSLGGRKMTRFIATSNPASSTEEETAPPLKYGFRAKRIKKQPAMDEMMSDNVLSKYFTDQISKLDRELHLAMPNSDLDPPAGLFEELTEQLASMKEEMTMLDGKSRAPESNKREKNDDLKNLNEATVYARGDGQKIVEKESVLPNLYVSFKEYETEDEDEEGTSEISQGPASITEESGMHQSSDVIGQLHAGAYKERKRRSIKKLNQLATKFKKRINSFT